jgi:hypothetical protein
MAEEVEQVEETQIENVPDLKPEMRPALILGNFLPKEKLVTLTENLEKETAKIKVSTEKVKPVTETKIESASVEVKKDPPEETNPLLSPKKENSTIEINELNDVIKLVEPLGLDIKEAKDLNKIVDSYKDISSKYISTQEENKSLNQLKNFILSAPDDILDILTEIEKDPDFDYKTRLSELSGQTIDYRKDFKSQIKLAVLKYGKVDLTDEDLEDIDDSPEKQKIVLMAEQLFLRDKKELDQQKKSQIQKIERQKEMLSQSAKESMAYLRKGDYSFNDSNAGHVESILTSGHSALLQLFCKEDGSYRPDAAERIAWLMYGKDAARILSKKESSEATTKVVEEMVSRASDTPKPKTGAVNADRRKEELKGIMNSIIPKQEKSIF